MLKRLIIFFLVSFSFLGLSLEVTSASTESSLPLKVKVGIYENPPKIYTENGNPKGFWPDIVKHIAAIENWDVEYVNGTFDEGLSRLRNNEIDMFVDVAYSPERSKIYDFTTETAFINWAAVYSKPGVNVNSFADLNGKKIAVLNSDIHFVGPLGLNALMNSFGYTAEYQHLPSYADALQAVSDGEADIAIVNRIFGSYSEGDYEIKKTNLVFNPIELKFALQKNTQSSKYFKDVLDKNLQLLKDDSESIYYKSIIENLEGVVKTVEVTPDWIQAAIVFLVSVLIGILILFLAAKRYQYVLQKEVESKTQKLQASENTLKEKIHELETVMQSTVDRELKMAELKKTIRDKELKTLGITDFNS